MVVVRSVLLQMPQLDEVKTCRVSLPGSKADLCARSTSTLSPGSPVIVRGVLFGLRCIYNDKAAFETAMRDFADDPVSWTDYARVR